MKVTGEGNFKVYINLGNDLHVLWAEIDPVIISSEISHIVFNDHTSFGYQC